MSPDVVIGILPDRTLFTRDAAFWRTQGFWRQDHAYALRTVDGDTRASLSKHPGPQTFSGGNYTQGNTVYCTPLRHPFSQTTHTRSGEIWRPLGRTEAYVRIPTIAITRSDEPITDSGGFRSPWRRAEVHRGAGVGLRV